MVRLRIVRRTLAALLLSLATLNLHAQPPNDPIAMTVIARAIQPGEVVRLDVSCSCAVAAATATVFGRKVALFPVDPANIVNPGNREDSVTSANRVDDVHASVVWRGLIGIDVEAAPGKYSIAVAVERSGEPALTAAHQLVVVAKRFPTRRLTVAARFVDPPPAETDRILTEARRLQMLFDEVTPRLLWHGSMQLPVTAEPSGSFGMRSVFNGQARSPHGGTDFPSPIGAPIAAPAAGTIVLAEELFFTGNTVVIDHGLGLYSLMAHLSRIDVKRGDTVQQAQTIGLVGATGRVTGPHLHWTTRLGGARIDPLSLVAIATTKE